MPPALKMEHDRPVCSSSPQLLSTLDFNDGRNQGLRTSTESLTQALAQQNLLGERASTWPLGPEARSKYGVTKDSWLETSPEVTEGARGSDPVLERPPARLSKRQSRSRFSLPTIQELRTYERDVAFARLDDRPKRGLNLPRSQSMRPSAMSALLATAALGDDDDDTETLSTSSPNSSRSRSTRQIPALSSPTSTTTSSSTLQLPPSIESIPLHMRRTANSPGTPVPSTRRPNRTAFFATAD